LCDAYGFSEVKKKILLDEFDNDVRQAKSEIPTQVQKVFYKRTTDVLANAVENNDSDIDINVLSGGNTKYAEGLLKQRQEYSRDKAWSISVIEKKNKGIELSEQEKEKLFLYNAKYNQALGDILDYDKSLDPYGKKLAGLMMKAQSFSNEEKQEFMKLLYNKAVKNEEAPAKWTKSDIDAFENEFKNFFKWAGNKDDSREYLQLRSRAISIAKLRGLSVQEAIMEMKKDEFYKISEIQQNRNISKNALLRN
jgi:uncharacterized protein (DUF302 family)